MLRQNEIEKTFYVYMYTSPSGKHYVGRTCLSQYERAGKLGIRYKTSRAFWNAIQKYGWENFSYKVLEEGILADDIDKRENYWINYYHSSTDENGYNLLKPNGTFKQATEECKKRLSETRRGEKNPAYGKHRPFPHKGLEKAIEINSKPVMQFDLNGNYIRTYSSRREAANSVHCQEVNIGKCCLGTHKQAGGYQWCDVGNENNIEKYFSKAETKGEIAQISNGKIINIFKNARVATKILGKKDFSSIYKCLNGERKKAFGFTWICVTDIDQYIIDDYYNSLNEEYDTYAS